jgi:hypothetical protein
VEDSQPSSADTTGSADTAREEVARTEPAKAPLPDPAGLAHSLSPVDLPEPTTPLPRPLRWTVTVIATAALFLALFNGGAIRGWAYELKPTAFSQRVVAAAEAWYDVTASVGLDRPVEAMRGWWKAATGAETETGSDAAAPEPAS